MELIKQHAKRRSDNMAFNGVWLKKKSLESQNGSSKINNPWFVFFSLRCDTACHSGGHEWAH